MEKNKNLYRSSTNTVLAGICGGLGEFFSIDAVLVRLIWLLIVVFTGLIPGVLVYIIAIYIIPKENTFTHATADEKPLA